MWGEKGGENELQQNEQEHIADLVVNYGISNTTVLEIP